MSTSVSSSRASATTRRRKRPDTRLRPWLGRLLVTGTVGSWLLLLPVGVASPGQARAAVSPREPLQAFLLSDLPVAARGLVKGSFKQGFRWNDLDGENYLILTETGTFETPGRKMRQGFDAGQDAELYAYRFVNVNGRFSPVWQVTDFVRNCPLDITAEFLPAATEVTDLDNDGFAEAWVMYKTACRSDVSPATLKLIMYEINQKYAMRGRTRIALPDFSVGGEKTPDARLRANRAFLRHAERKWKQFCVEISQ